MTPLKKAKLKVLKNIAENEVGEGKQMAGDPNLPQNVPQRSKTSQQVYFSDSQIDVKYWNTALSK